MPESRLEKCQRYIFASRNEDMPSSAGVLVVLSERANPYCMIISTAYSLEKRTASDMNLGRTTK
jgi:hypothetical protein